MSVLIRKPRKVHHLISSWLESKPHPLIKPEREYLFSAVWSHNFILDNWLHNFQFTAEHSAARNIPAQLEEIISDGCCEPEQVFNADETGVIGRRCHLDLTSASKRNVHLDLRQQRIISSSFYAVICQAILIVSPCLFIAPRLFALQKVDRSTLPFGLVSWLVPASFYYQSHILPE